MDKITTLNFQICFAGNILFINKNEKAFELYFFTFV